MPLVVGMRTRVFQRKTQLLPWHTCRFNSANFNNKNWTMHITMELNDVVLA